MKVYGKNPRRNIGGNQVPTFWRMDAPKYGDYKSAFINGELEHPYQLPDIKCDVCSGGNCSEDMILPYECPVEWREEAFMDSEAVGPSEFEKLVGKLQKTVPRSLRLPTTLIRPGCELQPCFLDIPSKPTADFLWCYIGSVVVSERVKALFDALKVASVRFCPVSLRKVGTRSAKLPSPIPSTGEPEHIINEVRVRISPKSAPRYYEMVILAKSKPPPGATPTEVCSICGAKTLDWSKRRPIMLASMWTGDDIFLVDTTGYILVTDKLRKHLERLCPTNVEFKEPPIA